MHSSHLVNKVRDDIAGFIFVGQWRINDCRQGRFQYIVHEECVKLSTMTTLIGPRQNHCKPH